MKREPCMTLTDLAKEKKIVRSAVFNKWAKRVPLPAQEVFEDRQQYKSNATGRKYYKRSELLDWYERAKP